MRDPQELLIDLSEAIVAEPGTSVQLPENESVWCAICVKTSNAGRCAEYSIRSSSSKPLLCAPAFGTGRRVRAAAHYRMWCDPGEEQTFAVPLPAGCAGDRFCLYVESESAKFIYVLTLESPAWAAGHLTALAMAVVGGLAAGSLAALLWTRLRRTRPALAPREAGDDDAPRNRAPEPPAQPPAAEPSPIQPAPARAAESRAQPDVRLADPIVEEPRTSVAFSGADGAVMGTIEMSERTQRKANYTVRIVNDSPHPLICAAMGVRGRSYTALRPSHFRVEPRSASAILIAVPLRLWLPFHQMLVNMRSSSLSYTLEAEVPKSPIRPALAALALLVVLAAIAAAAFAQARPRIAAYALPSRALAGSRIRAEYAVAGIGAASYAVDVGNRQIASGTLASGNGSFTFPATVKPAIYRVVLAMRGPFGAQTASRTVQTVEPNVRFTQGATAMIRAFEVDDAVVRSGQPIVARYVSSAEGGSVRLLDAAAVTIAQVPYSRGGASTIPAPSVARQTPYRLELVARTGTASQTASIGISVIPASATPAPSVGVNAPPVLTAAQLLAIFPPYVRGGLPIRIRLLRHPSRLTLLLQNGQGVSLESKSVAPKQTSVRFVLPPVTADQTFVIVARFRQGNGDQVVLAPFVVHAR